MLKFVSFYFYKFSFVHISWKTYLFNDNHKCLVHTNRQKTILHKQMTRKTLVAIYVFYVGDAVSKGLLQRPF